MNASFSQFPHVLLGVGLSLAAACDAATEPVAPTLQELAATPEAAAEGDGQHASYSPFVVDVRDMSLPFDQVTFKDVGMSLPPAERAFVYETVAESVRESLAASGVAASVRYDTQWSDPLHHVSCEGQHVYVDLWHPTGTEEWGYSLWSGCGADSEFGGGQVTGHSDAVAAAMPVAEDIAKQLRAAAETQCFRKNC